MDEEDRSSLIDLLAVDPDAGVSLGGGLYKVRLAREGQGKSGGYRIVYFFRDEEIPIFLITAFAKNQKANLTRNERADLIEFCRALAKGYGKQK